MSLTECPKCYDMSVRLDTLRAFDGQTGRQTELLKQNHAVHCVVMVTCDKNRNSQISQKREGSWFRLSHQSMIRRQVRDGSALFCNPRVHGHSVGIDS